MRDGDFANSSRILSISIFLKSILSSASELFNCRQLSRESCEDFDYFGLTFLLTIKVAV
jgi:hypothetical protein